MWSEYRVLDFYKFSHPFSSLSAQFCQCACVCVCVCVCVCRHLSIPESV